MEPVSLTDKISYVFYDWKPNRELNPQFAHRPDIDKLGLILIHSTPQGKPCRMDVLFNVPGSEYFGDTRWKVHKWDPLTIQPSLLCECGEHGFILEGQWVDAQNSKFNHGLTVVTHKNER